LLYATLTYINVLAEYLHREIRGESLDWILSLQIPGTGIGAENYPLLSVIPRRSFEQII